MFNPMVGLHFGQNRIPLSFRSVWCPHIQHRCGGILDMVALLWAFAEAVSGTGTFPSGGAPAQLVNHAGGRVGQGEQRLGRFGMVFICPLLSMFAAQPAIRPAFAFENFRVPSP